MNGIWKYTLVFIGPPNMALLNAFLKQKNWADYAEIFMKDNEKTAVNDSVIGWLILYDECVITINKQ